MNLNPFSNTADSLTSLLSVGRDIVDTLFTSDKEKRKANLKLVKAIQAGKLKKAQQEIQRLKTNSADRDSARAMYRKTRSWVVPFLAITFTMGFFGVIMWVLYYGVPDGQSQVTWMLVGTLQTATVTILTFFFGRTDRDDQTDASMPLDGPQTATAREEGPPPGMDTRKEGKRLSKSITAPSSPQIAPLATINTDDNE
jgi:hypothetical protein